MRRPARLACILSASLILFSCATKASNETIPEPQPVVEAAPVPTPAPAPQVIATPTPAPAPTPKPAERISLTEKDLLPPDPSFSASRDTEQPAEKPPSGESTDLTPTISTTARIDAGKLAFKELFLTENGFTVTLEYEVKNRSKYPIAVCILNIQFMSGNTVVGEVPSQFSALDVEGTTTQQVYFENTESRGNIKWRPVIERIIIAGPDGQPADGKPYYSVDKR